MPIPMTAHEVLEREFLEIRAKLLELAASFDRLDRAEGRIADDPRTALFRGALEILQGDSDDRAEQLQLLFSRDYEDHWQDEFNIAPR